MWFELGKKYDEYFPKPSKVEGVKLTAENRIATGD